MDVFCVDRERALRCPPELKKKLVDARPQRRGGARAAARINVYGTSVSLGRAIPRVDLSLCPGYDLFVYFASSSMNSAAYEGRYRRESQTTRAQHPKGLPS